MSIFFSIMISLGLLFSPGHTATPVKKGHAVVKARKLPIPGPIRCFQAPCPGAWKR